MFTSGHGFVVDYPAEIPHNLRNVDYGSASSSISQAVAVAVHTR